MAKFMQLSNEKVRDREAEISKYWKEIDLFNESVKQREDGPEYIFYDGPPTANGKPGIHHVIARTLKDMNCRYKTMRGFKVKRKAGWDTHGLPVEISVEKELGLKSKKEIEEYGVEKFNKKCRDSVFTNEAQWREMSDRMAFLADMDNPYITLENDYIETVWWILDNLFKKGLIYEGAKILPYCPRCGTGLASHEVAQGYEEIKTQTLYVKFKIKGKDEYFLAWTTTPWTLPSNVALTVNPDMDYVRVKYKDEIYYCADVLKDSVFPGEYEVLDKVKGKELEYIEYEQLITDFKTDKKAFFVTVADYVSSGDGTGIVHTAPAFGEDDYQTGRRYDLPLINPVNEEGKFISGTWENMFVMDADPFIIEKLFDEKKAFRKLKVSHNYPHCWRCHTPLIYYAKPSWYIEVTKYKDKLIENNKNVKWYPDFVGEKRFGNWLENLNDWAISRSRYWGTPFPVWKCEQCNHITSIGSKKELIEKSIEDIDENIDLHRPFVDEIHIKCEKCGNPMTREKDVIDVWFDSGAMPFAQSHYPFEHEEEFLDKLFPADFICEGIDQIRGWFYSLLAISTLITGKAPYKNVLVNDLILDKDGKKMSKSRGNTLNPIELFDEYGADVVRFYSLYVSPPHIPTRFNVEGLREVESKFFRSYRNVYNFFSLYANADNFEKDSIRINYQNLTDIDNWILSRYNNLLKSYIENMDKFEITKTVRELSDFVVEDLSNWYIRRNRRRFWKSEADNDKMAVYATTYEILLGVTRLSAPFTPFIAEEIFRNLTDGKSVHLEIIPSPNDCLINPGLEERMELVRKFTALGRASREEVKIKVRQPLFEIVVDSKFEDKIKNFTDIIKEELNVKNVVFEDDLSKFMNYTLKPDFKVCGKLLGNKIKSFGKFLADVNPKEFLNQFKDSKTEIMLDGERVEILKEYLDIRINSKEGFNVAMDGDVFVILDTELTKDLLNEGYAREFISKVQQMRKVKDLEVLDNIEIKYSGNKKIQEAIKIYEEFIKKETLATDIIKIDDLENAEVEDLNGEEAKLAIERI